jgi:hypothetical protein
VHTRPLALLRTYCGAIESMATTHLPRWRGNAPETSLDGDQQGQVVAPPPVMSMFHVKRIARWVGAALVVLAIDPHRPVQIDRGPGASWTTPSSDRHSIRLKAADQTHGPSCLRVWNRLVRALSLSEYLRLQLPIAEPAGLARHDLFGLGLLGVMACPRCRAPSCRAPSCRAPSCRAPSCRAPSCRAPSCRAGSCRAGSCPGWLVPGWLIPRLLRAGLACAGGCHCGNCLCRDCSCRSAWRVKGSVQGPGLQRTFRSLPTDEPLAL